MNTLLETPNKKPKNFLQELTSSIKSNGSHELYFKKMIIGPKEAQTLLEKNISENRSVRKAQVLRYANDMKGGRWKTNTGETIKITNDGTVVDGQHRLLAVIKAGVEIEFEVAFNVSSDTFDVLDTGCTRTAGDSFKVSGIRNANAIPAIIQQYHILSTGNGVSDDASKSQRLTNAQLLQQYYLNETYWQEVAKKGHLWYRSFSRILKQSWTSGLYAFLETLDDNKAFEFMEQLCTGANITHEVINLLRNKLISDVQAQRRISQGVKMGLIIKAWNVFRMDKPIKILKFDPKKELFPVAI